MDVPMEDATSGDIDVLQRRLDKELAVLRLLPGVTSVTDYPAGGMATVKSDLNKNGVRLKLDGRLINSHFNSSGVDDKLRAALALKEKVRHLLGSAAITA